jgi:hypothetical protein
MSKEQTFEILPEKDKGSEATHIAIHFDVEKFFGAKRVPVKFWAKGAEHCGTIIPVSCKYGK